jgi:hypothetical protein
MRFRTGLIVGGAVGYYLGAKAGRQRYEQLNRWIHRVGESAPVQTATDKVKSAAGRGPDSQYDELTLDIIEPEWSN